KKRIRVGGFDAIANIGAVMALLLPALVTTLALIAPQQLRDTTRLRWVPSPRATYGGWVSDPAHHLRPETVAAIDSTVARLEREKSVEIAVVVIDSLDGLDPANAALLLHRRWGVGKGARDNGIVFLWSPALRKTWMSVGYGLEGVIPDAVAGRIQDEWVIPAFRSGDFDGGVLAGVGALAAAANNESYSGPPRARIDAPPKRRGLTITFRGKEVTPEESPIQYFVLNASSWLILGLVLLLFLSPLLFPFFAPLVYALWLARRFLPRRCPNGHGWLRRLSETEDDAFLSPDDVLEEKLDSVNYDVWVCSKCEHRQVIPRPKWGTKHTRCPKCNRKTLETLRFYGGWADGSVRIRERCLSCKYHDKRTEILAPAASGDFSSSGGDGGSSGSSDGGGSSGGSFGGGSAGGGGAGRSY
ncbi:MAG TPA: TPM domain-containing protein, partial [Gemmatimonadaceae bacterium]